MESGNPIAGLIGLWMFLKLAGFIGLLAGGLYLLYCVSRAASGIERIADALERQAVQDRPPAPAGPPFGAATHGGAASQGAPQPPPPSPLPPV